MYKSREIRWFKNNSDTAILDWFAQKGQTFDNTKARSDFYLSLAKDDITVKLREGNIEIKQRTGDIKKSNLAPYVEGIFENWVKWSFNVDKADRQMELITQGKEYDWIETVKTRIGVKLTIDNSGKMQILPISNRVDFGCQIEYTHLIIKDQTFYTFALEWFGEPNLEINSDILTEILGSTYLGVNISSGYGQFLTKSNALLNNG